MIQANEELAAMMHVQEHLRTITHVKTKAQLKIKAFDTGVLTGVKPTAILVDELHEIARSPHAARIIGQLRGGLIPNKEGFLAFISTQSDQPPAGVFRTELNNARDIRDGKIKGSVLPILYEFPPDILADGTWRDPTNWSMVTPNIGRSVELKRLVEDFELGWYMRNCACSPVAGRLEIALLERLKYLKGTHDDEDDYRDLPKAKAHSIRFRKLHRALKGYSTPGGSNESFEQNALFARDEFGLDTIDTEILLLLLRY
jgi:hypothetical protein